jgi:proteasome lid subunit RPN8/RPN11
VKYKVKEPKTIPVKEAKEFEPVATLANLPGVGEVMLGKDLRLYRRTKGLMQIICPVDPEEDLVLYHDQTLWDEYPGSEYLADLFDKFLSKYKREVMVVVGKRYNPRKGQSPWLFMVPKQVGTLGSIEWEDPDGMDWFLEKARFLGTIHIHPGDSCDPSGTDIGHFEEKVNSGLHVIFARTGQFKMFGSANGYVIKVTQGTIEGIERKECTLVTSCNRPLKKLLLVPPPPKKVKAKKTGRGRITRHQQIIKFPGKKNRPDWADEVWDDSRDTGPWGDYLWAESPMGTVEDGMEVAYSDELWVVVNGLDTFVMSPTDYYSYRITCLAEGWDKAPKGIQFHQGDVFATPGGMDDV